MTQPESRKSAGDVSSPAEELRVAIGGFVSEFKTFSNQIQSRIEQQETRMTQFERKSVHAASMARPALSVGADTEVSHRKAVSASLRTGDDDGLRGLVVESKALSSAVAGDGGYLLDPQTAASIKSTLSGTASIRAIANVVTVDATSYDVLIDHSEMGAGWANETDPSAETGTPGIDRITIALHELSALPKASQRLLDDSAFDIEGWLAGRIADKFARSEAAAFIAGDGVDKPKGILSYPVVDNDVWDWGNVGYVATGVDGGFDATSPADAIIDLVYSLTAEYRSGASFVMNSRTAGTLRKLKDSDGRFLWSDGLANGEPARLLGYPVLVAEDMPEIGSDSLSVAFGNFAAGYTVAERPDLRVLRDPFSAKPHVLFYATKRVGGGISDFAAIKLLKFGIA